MYEMELGEDAGMAFRYESKIEYEAEIKRLISVRNSSSSSKKKNKGIPNPEVLDEVYDSLVEEYLSFCASGGDGE
jgi:hypothetical protein